MKVESNLVVPGNFQKQFINRKLENMLSFYLLIILFLPGVSLLPRLFMSIANGKIWFELKSSMLWILYSCLMRSKDLGVAQDFNGKDLYTCCKSYENSTSELIELTKPFFHRKYQEITLQYFCVYSHSRTRTFTYFDWLRTDLSRPLSI